LLKHTQIPNFVKTLPVGAELFHEDGRTDRHMTKLRVASRNFANAPNKTKYADNIIGQQTLKMI